MLSAELFRITSSNGTPDVHVLCPPFTRGAIRKMAERSMKRPQCVFLLKIQHSVDVNKVTLITMKGIKLIS